MAEKVSKATQNIQVPREVARLVNEVADEMNTSQKELVGRVMAWFVNQPLELRVTIGWPLPDSIRRGVIDEVLRVLQLPGSAAEASLSLGEQVQTAGTGETEAPVLPPADAAKGEESTRRSDAGRDAKRRRRPRR